MPDSSSDPRRKVVALEPRQLGLGEVFYRTSDAVVVAEATVGRVVLWNEAAARLFGYSTDEGLGLLIEDLIPEELKTRHRSGLTRYGRDGGGALIDSGAFVELPAVHRDGHDLFVQMSLTSLGVPRAPGRYVMAIVRDVTERKQLEDDLRCSYALVEETQALAKVGSWEWDTTAGLGGTLTWSRQMYPLHGVDPETFEPSPLAIEELIHAEDLEGWRSQFAGTISTGRDVTGFAYRAVHPDGQLCWLWTEGHVDAGRPGVFVGFVQDITAQKAANDELERLALVDELTGLHNRRGFFTIAEALLQLARRERHNMVLLYIDLDDMKQINDAHGHAGGDRALVEAAEVLTTSVRESDLTARVGGDEFCLLLRQDTADPPLTRLLDAVAQRRAHGSRISLTVGTATERWDEPTSIDDLVARADADMYNAKKRRTAQDR